MQMITNLVRDIQIIAAAIVIILLLFGGVGVYMFKFRKRAAAEEAVDDSSFRREDALCYVGFDDVTADMLVSDGGKRFIAAIKCQGFSFADAEVDEKVQTIRGYITFFNVLDNAPIQFRQSSRDVNLDGLIQDYQTQSAKLQERRFTLNLDYTETKAESENQDLSAEDYEIYYEKLKQMQRELVSLGHQAEQLDAQVRYMQAITGNNAEAKREEIYVFDWHYNAIDFSSQMLEEQEVYQRAESQLRSKSNAYIAALRNCGVHAKRMTGVEFLEEIRRYTHPVSSAKGTVEDIAQMAYDGVCVTSNSLHDFEEEANKKIIKEMAQGVRKEKGGRQDHA